MANITNSITSAGTNLANAESNRDSALANAISGNSSIGTAISADQAITQAASTNQSIQAAASQILGDRAGSIAGAVLNPSLYTGNILGKASDTISNALNNKVPSLSSLASGLPSSAPTSAAPPADRRIRLRPKSGISQFVGTSEVLKPLISTNGFMFPYTPTVQLSRQAKYSDHSTVHNIQDYKAYTGTSAVTFEISGVFTAQNKDEALFMLACYHFMKASTLMSFGKDSMNVAPPGTPPPVLLLSGYGSFMMNDLPSVIEDFSMELPNDVDYIEITVAGSVINLPTRTTMSIKGTVQNTPATLRKFDWGAYLNGSLMSQKGWY